MTKIKKLETTVRDRCIIDGSNLTTFYTIKDFPALMLLTDDMNYHEDLTADMVWANSEKGTACIRNLIDPRLLYSYSHNPGTVGKIWKDHHQRFFNFINDHPYQNVLEIGGSSGNLLDNFLRTNKTFNWTLLEPALNTKINDQRVCFIKDFFENYSSTEKFDTIIHSHVFEHIYNPIDFLKKVNYLLEDDGIQYISIPNMTEWMNNNFSSVMSFEHTYFIDENIAEYLLNKTGFEIIDKVVNSHSIFVKAKKISSIIEKPADFTYIKTFVETYLKRIKDDIEHVKKSIGSEKFYLFGGTVNSQFLLKLGLDQSKVINLLDNDPHKHNKRLYGTNVIVVSPSVLKNINSPIVVVRSGPYNEEIKNGILQINSTVRFF